MKIVLFLVSSFLIMSFFGEHATGQILEPSQFLMQRSYSDADSSITFDQMAFAPGESLNSVDSRFHNFRRYGIEVNGDKALFVPFSNVMWVGMTGRGWIIFDSLDHAEKLYLSFKNDSYDTVYLRLSRLYGLPDREFFNSQGSIWGAMFHDSVKVIELAFDSNEHCPVIVSWAPIHGSRGVDEWRPRDRQWYSLGHGKGVACFVDTGTYPSHLIVAKYVNDSEIKAVKIEAAEKYPTLGYDKYAYGLFTYKCDCENHQITTVRILHCSSEDKPIYLYPPSKRYYNTHPVSPHSIEEAVFDHVCNRLKKLHN
jgi:hypothetical protein